MGYSFPFNPFPFPEDLACGEPYIHWPANYDLLAPTDIDTEVAVPESWIDVGVDGEEGTVNRTKEAYILVMPRKRTIRCETTKFVPAYRNKQFESSDDKFFKPDKYYLEYIGPPSTHIRNHTCDVTYHLLSYRFSPSILQGYKLARYEGNDWLFQLYSDDAEEKPYEMPTKKPLAESRVINVCDRRGKHTKYNRGGRQTFKCDFPEYVEKPPEPCYGSGPRPTQSVLPTPMPKPSQVAGGGKGTNLGLAIGLPVGIIGALMLVGLLTYFAPRLQRRFRREGAIQL